MKVFGIILSALLLTTQMFAQCEDLDNHPKGRNHAMSLTVYQDFIKSKDYAGAIPKWSELYEHCKGAFKGKILNDGEKIYKGLAKKEKDAAKKKEYNEKVAEIMTHKITCFGAKKRKNGLAYTGYRYYQLGKHYAFELNDYEKAKEAFENSIEADGKKVEANLLYYYSYVAVKLFKDEAISADDARAIHAKIMEIADSNPVEFEEAKEKAVGEYRDIERDIFDCNYFIERIAPDFYKNYNNADYIQENIFLQLKRADCSSEHPLVVKAQDRIRVIRDSVRDANKDLIDRGNDALREDRVSEAKNYYTQGIADVSISAEKRYEGAMRLGKLQQKDSEWSNALSTFKKAADLNSSSGEPYISTGLLYLAANKSCSGFERQLVTGAALDQFRKAKNYSNTASDASDKISTYSQYLPTREVLFQRGMSVGAGRTVGCVLKASTTVQSKD